MAKLGQQVDYYCGTCKVDRYHTVAAVSPDGRNERIVCGYCNSARKYREPTAPTTRKTSASGGTRRTRASAEPLETVAVVHPYSPHQEYDKGDVIQHPKYGRGRVADVRGDRIDVKFADGAERTFLHRPGAR